MKHVLGWGRHANGVRLLHCLALLGSLLASFHHCWELEKNTMSNTWRDNNDFCALLELTFSLLIEEWRTRNSNISRSNRSLESIKTVDTIYTKRYAWMNHKVVIHPIRTVLTLKHSKHKHCSVFPFRVVFPNYSQVVGQDRRIDKMVSEWVTSLELQWWTLGHCIAKYPIFFPDSVFHYIMLINDIMPGRLA